MHKNKTVLTIVIVSILSCAYAATLAPTTPEEKSEKQPTFIAVLPFSNQTGDEKLDWLSVGLQDALTIDLYYLSAFQVKALPEIVLRLSLTPSQIAAIPREKTHEIGQKLYADVLLLGSYEKNKDGFLLKVQLFDVKARAILAQAEVAGEAKIILSSGTKLLLDLVKSLNIDASPDERARMRSVKSENPLAVELNAKGFEKYVNREKNIEEAIQFFEKAVEADESYAEAWNNLGWALYRTDNYDKALATWEQALKLKQYCVLSLLGEGILYGGKKEYKLARNSLEKAVALNPSIPFRGYLGFIYSQLKEWELALREYTQMASFTQEPEERFKYLFRSARILFFNMDDLNAALSKYAEALKTTADPEKKSLCLTQMGLILLYKEDLEGALARYQEALGLTQAPERRADCLLSIGFILRTKGDLEGALTRYEEALKLIKKPETKSRCLHSIGKILEMKGNLEEALARYEEALKLAQNPDMKAAYLDSIGKILKTKGDLEGALTRFEEALKLAQDSFSKAACLSSIGRILETKGDLEGALTRYEEALKFAQSPEEKALCLVGIGLISQRRGDLEGALARYEEALKFAQKDSMKATCFNSIGTILATKGDLEGALTRYEEALKFAQNPEMKITYLSSIGRILMTVGDLEGAMARYEEAMKLTKNPEEKAKCLNSIGTILEIKEDVEGALMKYEEALSLAQNPNRKAVYFSSIGRILETKGDLEGALMKYEEALSLAQDPERKAGYLSSIGRIFEAKGDLEKAFASCEDALRLTSNPVMKSFALFHIGAIFETKGDLEDTLASYQEALKVTSSHLPNPTQEEPYPNPLVTDVLYPDLASAVAVAKGVALEKLAGKEAEGNVLFLLLAKQSTDFFLQLTESLRRSVMGEEGKMGFLEARWELYEFAMPVRVLLKLHALIPEQGYDLLAFNYAEAGKARSFIELLQDSHAKVEAGIPSEIFHQEKTLKEALIAKENLILHAEDEKLKRQWLEARNAAKREIERFQRKLEEEFPRYAELKYPKPFTFQQVRDEVLDERTVLLEYLLGKEESYLWVIFKEKKAPLLYRLPGREKLEELVKEYRDTLIKPLEYRYFDAEGKERFGNNVQKHRQLGYQLYQLLLKPVMDENKELIANKRLLIVPDGILYYLPYEALIINPPEEETATYFLQTDFPISYAPSASVLGTIKRDKMRKESKTQYERRRIIAFGDAVFEEADLQAERKKEAESKAEQVTLAKKASVKREPQKSSSWPPVTRSAYGKDNNTFLRLEHTKRELEAVKEIYGSQAEIYQRLQATEEVVKSGKLREFKLLHFATHGVLNEHIPRLSAIILTQDEDDLEDGFLTMGEILNIQLEADLVVLSACQTGLGKSVKGEGLVGLTRAFIYAGTPSVLVSLWSVNDESTAVLMKQFYKHLQDMPKGEALRQARKDLIKGVWNDEAGVLEAYQAPYFWAPFILVGDWR